MDVINPPLTFEEVAEMAQKNLAVWMTYPIAGSSPVQCLLFMSDSTAPAVLYPFFCYGYCNGELTEKSAPYFIVNPVEEMFQHNYKFYRYKPTADASSDVEETS